MKSPASLVALLAVTSAAAAFGGCASDDGAQRNDESYASAVQRAGERERLRAAGAGRDPSRDMRVENEMGVLETADVEDTLQGHFQDVRACYQRAGKAQEYAGGRVLLRFIVAGDGR